MAGVRKRLGSLLGPTGQAAGIAAVTAETVAPASPAQAIASGPSSAKAFHFKIPQGVQGLPGVNAVPADEAVAAYIGTAGSSATKTAVLSAIRSRATVIDVRDYGTKGDNVADDTAALQAAFDAAAGGVAFGRDATVFMPFGTYKVSSPLTLLASIEADQATINYTGTGTAFTVGNTATTQVITRRNLRLPSMTCAVNTAAGAWSATPIVGFRLINLNDCLVYNRETRHFDDGIIIEGRNQGVVHCEFHVGTLWGNRRNLVLNPSGTGWVNQNLFLGGRHVPNVTWGVVDDPDACSGVLFMGAAGAPNNNTWIGTSFEGASRDLYRLDVAGRNNYFLNCRWEHAVGATLRVRWRASAQNNKIEQGYDSNRITEVFEAGATNNKLQMAVDSFAFRATQIGATSIPNDAVNVPLTAWGGVLGNGASLDAATGDITLRQGRWEVGATVHVNPVTTAAGYIELSVMVNGVVMDLHRLPAATQVQKLTVQWRQQFVGTEKVRFVLRQTSGQAVTLITSARFCQFHCEYLG